MKYERIGKAARTALPVLGFLLAYLAPVWLQKALFALSGPPWELAIRLFSTAATVGVVLLFALILERRSPASMGFVKKKGLSDYGIGLLCGGGLFALSLLLCLLWDAVSVQPTPVPSWGWIAMYFLGYGVQGFSEEVLCRAYLLTALHRRLSPTSAVLFSALIFATLHLGNTGLTVIGFLNVFLFGILTGICFMRRGNVWGVAALHTAWNFVQGHVFGIHVSGHTVTTSILSTTPQTDAWWLHGGAFGLEGGLAVTAVLLLVTAVVFRWPHRDS